MIRFARPAAPPVLLKKGTAARKKHCDEYESTPADYRRGVKFFKSGDFDGSIYAAAEVKEALIQAQRNKCAFCESFVRHVSYGTVEHFRPKAGYKQRKGGPLKRPGYYWLAYDWDNLFFCCELCNEQFKENLFPLKDGRRRARSHTEDLGKEEPLLVNPATQDPSSYIGFREEYAFPVNGWPEGEVTIEVFGLNREALAEVRRRHLQDLEALVQLCELLRKEANEKPTPQAIAELQLWEKRLEAKSKDDAEYAAMARAFLSM